MVAKRIQLKGSGEVFHTYCSILNMKFKLIAENFFLSDPDLKSDVPLEYLSHKQKYEEAVRKACILFKKVQQLQNEGRGGMDNFR